MKLIIDIPEEVLKRTVFYREFRDLNDCVTIIKALENGIPIPDNATNGDIIKAMFPNSVVLTDILAEIVEFETEDDGCEMRCTVDWWNSLYQKGGKE